jgi:hypothetical protein
MAKTTVRRAERHALLVSQLQKVIDERAAAVEVLAAKHTQLSSREYAVRCVCAHTDALRFVTQNALGFTIDEDEEDDSAASEADAASLGSSDHAACASPQAAACPSAGRPPPVPLGWCPSRVMQLLVGSRCELTSEGLRRKLREMVAIAGCQLP